MATTTSLLAPLVEVGQLAKESTINTTFSYFDSTIAGYLSKSVAGSSNITLTETEARNAVIECTGTLTGNIALLVPQRERVYVIFNNTAGAFSLTVRPVSSGTGVAVVQGTHALLYCNATNVVAGPGGSGSGVTDGDKGDITVSSSGTVWTVDNDVVTYAKMQNVSATNRLLGRSTSGAGDVEEITVGGDLTQSGSTFTIANDAVTYAKIQNVSTTDRLLGRDTSGAGDIEELTLSAVLDFVGSAAQGDVLYRDAATWTRLGAGTSGHFLQTQGAGANPQWAAAGVSGGAANKLAYWTGASALSNDTSLSWDSTNDILGLIATAGGTSGVGLIALGLGTAPTTGPADTAQIYAVDEAASKTGIGLTAEGNIKHLFATQSILGSQTRSASATQGLVIDQAGNSDAILQFRSTGGGVAHGMTALAATDIWADFRLVAAASGGLQLRTLTEGSLAMVMSSIGTTDPTTTKSTAAEAAMRFEFAKKNGTTGEAMGAGVNLVAFTDNFAGGLGTRWILDNDGDTWQAGELQVLGNINHDGSNIGFFGVAPAARASAYTMTNVTTDRALDCNATTVDEVADVLATLIADLKLYGLLQ